jgi:hypothetical protein
MEETGVSRGSDDEPNVDCIKLYMCRSLSNHIM